MTSTFMRCTAAGETPLKATHSYVSAQYLVTLCITNTSPFTPTSAKQHDTSVQISSIQFKVS
jgi:hypothetical protein